MDNKSPKTLLAIGLFKLVKGLLLVATGIGAFSLLHRDIGETAAHWVEVLRVDPDNRIIHGFLSHVFAVTPRQLEEIGVGTFFYAALLLTEGAGLVMRKHWAEYFTVITTAALIPLEIYEIARRFTATRVGVLAINVAIVVYRSGEFASAGPRPDSHSPRKAGSGSHCVARHAGMKLATDATAIRSTDMLASVPRSEGCTPNSRLDIERASARDRTTPIESPTNASFAPCRTIIPRTSEGFAPRAIRMPISCLRWVTEYAITPLDPHTGERQREGGEQASNSIRKRAGETDAATTSSIVRIRTRASPYQRRGSPIRRRLRRWPAPFACVPPRIGTATGPGRTRHRP